MRILSISMGVLTAVGGIAVTPGVIVAVFEDIEIGKPIGMAVSILLILLVSCLLISPDGVYRKHRGLVCAGVAIAAAGGVASFVAVAFASAFDESSLGAGLYSFLAAWGGVFFLADAVVLAVRLRRLGQAAA